MVHSLPSRGESKWPPCWILSDFGIVTFGRSTPLNQGSRKTKRNVFSLYALPWRFISLLRRSSAKSSLAWPRFIYLTWTAFLLALEVRNSANRAAAKSRESSVDVVSRSYQRIYSMWVLSWRHQRVIWTTCFAAHARPKSPVLTTSPW